MSSLFNTSTLLSTSNSDSIASSSTILILTSSNTNTDAYVGYNTSLYFLITTSIRRPSSKLTTIKALDIKVKRPDIIKGDILIKVVLKVKEAEDGELPF